MKRQVMIGATIVLLAVSGMAFAHHGWGSYDAATVMTVESAVTALEWQNPARPPRRESLGELGTWSSRRLSAWNRAASIRR